MRNRTRSIVFLAALALTAGCSSESVFGPRMDVEAKIVNQIATVDYHYEIALTNHGTTPVFVGRCQGVERFVGLSWVAVAHLSACASILPPERVEGGETLSRGATLPSVIVAEEAPNGGTFRFVLVLTESEAFAAPTKMLVRTGAFEL